jgi:5-methylcytosine-specific restriction endonuclease McrA
MSVSRLHLEEHFNIPLETPGRRKPPAQVRELIQDLYGNRCFGCDARKTVERELHIDHIIPQSKGGTSAFRNLQPLCERCGNIKGDRLPEEVEVCSTIFFGPYPSDSYEGLFW